MPAARLPRWVNRYPPRGFAPRSAGRYTKPRGSPLLTTGTTSAVPLRGVNFARRSGVNIESRLTRKRPRRALPGMMLHQDGSIHEWVPGRWWDLIVTMDDATSDIYSVFFVAEEGTTSSFQGVSEAIRAKGLFCSLYADRASHCWNTPEAGGKVGKDTPTQVGRALAQLGIKLIPAYSPEARGRSELSSC